MTATLPNGKPRLIAAMFSSPGPCYGLPGLTGAPDHDPRSVHNKAPAYSMRTKSGKYKDDCSPGPAYYPDPNYTRVGRKGDPSYSLYSRPKDCAGFRTPGPGAYCPETVGPQAYYSPPKYSFGTRHRNRQTDNTPGPNKYTVPVALGRTPVGTKRSAPCYSLRSRSNVGHFAEDLSKTPGPGTYKVNDPNTNKLKAPSYSMTSRNTAPGDTTTKPGPGAHFPENVYINKKQAPQFSFGIRHSEYLAPLIVECHD
ncbi:ciliary microtubule associated protein 1A-like isoform X3 [Liolophura sinensis]|uniref:ciliary microtubule associated protein 1A-like isoform X3 n=1 Tax=Liolophura sinensis TaxID=3198878 RepID=UPI003158ED12